jgi:hypothetical protein
MDEDSRAKGRIGVTILSDSSDPSVTGQKATVSVDDIMSVTEPADPQSGVRIALMEPIPSEVPWIFRTDEDDAPTWRVITVAEDYDRVQALVSSGESHGGLWSQADLDREREKVYTLQKDIKAMRPIRFKERRILLRD